MKMIYRYTAVILLLMASCKASSLKTDTQEKRIGDAVIRVTYLPIGWEKVNGVAPGKDSSEINFKVNITPGSAAIRNTGLAAAGYGLDTLFSLVLDHDTLPALFAEKIANGNPNNIEYLLGFERKPLSRYSRGELLFRDWLFTSSALSFSLPLSHYQKIDATSSGL